MEHQNSFDIVQEQKKQVLSARTKMKRFSERDRSKVKRKCSDEQAEASCGVSLHPILPAMELNLISEKRTRLMLILGCENDWFRTLIFRLKDLLCVLIKQSALAR